MLVQVDQYIHHPCTPEVTTASKLFYLCCVWHV